MRVNEVNGGAENVVESFLLQLRVEPFYLEELGLHVWHGRAFIARDRAVRHGKAGGELLVIIENFGELVERFKIVWCLLEDGFELLKCAHVWTCLGAMKNDETADEAAGFKV